MNGRRHRVTFLYRKPKKKRKSANRKPSQADYFGQIINVFASIALDRLFCYFFYNYKNRDRGVHFARSL
jgi:hypothetical protein